MLLTWAQWGKESGYYESKLFLMENMTQIPIGTKLKVLSSGKIVILEEIRNFPTRYKTTHKSGKVAYYKTFEVEVVESNDQPQDD